MSIFSALAAAHTDRSVRPASDLVRRTGILLYGVFSYAIGVVALVAMILTMLGVIPFFGLVTISSPVVAVLFNLFLLVAFAAQHSVMARKSFKDRWTKIIPPSMERSTYVLATGVFLLPTLALWQPLPSVLWSVEVPLLRAGLTGLAILGWAYLFIATFAIDHFELFGLQQVWREFRGREPKAVPFKERWMYRFDRHPIMTGLAIGLWATPDLTVGHLVFAAGMTVYAMIGVHFEERALRRQWGEQYEAYSQRVGTIVPLPFVRR